MEDFVTLYLSYLPTPEEVNELEVKLGRDVSLGSDFVNVYTQDVSIVRKAFKFLNALGCNVTEVSFEDIAD